MTDQLDVYLDGALTGRLTRSAGGRVSFDYAAGAVPGSLSVSMPASVTHHEPEVVMPWLDNLLPDSDEVRARWAAGFGLRRVTPFGLLEFVGADCAGAVQILPVGAAPVDAGELIPVSDADIAAQIRALRADSAAWGFPNRGGRWSLGGQQGKFALARTADGRWVVPSGRAASTHIVKVGVAGVPEADVAEYVTMRVARLLGLPVAETEYQVFDGEAALVTTRFDRLAGPEGVRRLHQEDLCQALGLWRTVKYEADGGPSAADVVALLRRALDPRDRRRGVEDFARSQVFNWLVAGTDAHAKNYALLHVGSRVVLAPFYDLIGTAYLWGGKPVHFEGRLAMKFGGEYRLRKVDSGRLDQAAAELGVDAGFLADTARTYADRLPDATRTALARLPDVVGPAVRQAMVERLAGRLTWTTAG